MACASVRVRCLPVVCLKFLVHAAPGLAGPREAEGGVAGEAGLDLSKEHLRTQELESCAPADTFGLSFLREGSGGGVRPPSLRRKPAVPARLGKKTTS